MCSAQDVVHVKYGAGDGAMHTWQVHKDSDRPSIGKTPTLQTPDIDFELDEGFSSLKSIFFNKIFADVTGFGSKMDRFLSDPTTPGYEAIADRLLTFDDPAAEDRDWKVKRGFEVLLAAANEPEVGMANMWKSGGSDGLHPYPNFEQYMPMRYFKAWRRAIPYMWAPESMWHLPKEELGWAIFTSVLDALRDRRSKVCASWVQRAS